jgi:hypothetical protein
VIVGVDLCFHRSIPKLSARERLSTCLRRCRSHGKLEAHSNGMYGFKQSGWPIHQPKSNHKAAGAAFRAMWLRGNEQGSAATDGRRTGE